jgi:hypothetical protein
MRVVRWVVAGAVCANLSGCFFIFIPGSLLRKVGDSISGAEGEHCVSRSVKVGDRVTFGDKVGTVQSLSGPSGQCQDTTIPIRAAVAF